MPGLLSSAVSLIWFLSQSLCPDGAQTWTDEVSDVQYGRLDSNVTLSCGKSQFRLPVFWHLNNSSLSPWHEVTSDGRLVLLHVDQSAQGNYSCYDTTGLLVHSVTLRLGRPPGLLNIVCQVPSHRYLRCSWSDSKTLLPTKYNASLKVGKTLRPCTLDIARRHCEVHQPPMWSSNVRIEITETNVLGSETSFADLKLLSLLKPDPPDAVMAQPLEDFPQKLGVSWNFPSSWQQHVVHDLSFQIRYRPNGSEYWSQINSKNSPAVIMDALAGHIHQVQVRAQDEINSDSQWSEWSPVVLVKPWEKFKTPAPTLSPEEEFTGYVFLFTTKPETAKSPNSGHEEEGNVGLVIILVIFSVLILAAVFSLIFVWWLRQKRRDEATKQVLTSMVRMKSMPI